MNKYQDSLNKIIKSCCSYCDDDNGCQNCKIKQRCNATAKSWVNTLQELIDKETKYQALEDRLGIDLPTLFKALTEVNGIWYKDCEKIIKVVVLSISTMRENKFCLECYYDFKRFRVDTKDFNKTWWLEKPKECEE